MASCVRFPLCGRFGETSLPRFIGRVAGPHLFCQVGTPRRGVRFHLNGHLGEMSLPRFIGRVASLAAWCSTQFEVGSPRRGDRNGRAGPGFAGGYAEASRASLPDVLCAKNPRKSVSFVDGHPLPPANLGMKFVNKTHFLTPRVSPICHCLSA